MTTKVFVCEDCGKQYDFADKPEKCGCGGEDTLVEVEIPKKDECGNIFTNKSSVCQERFARGTE